MPIFRRRSLIAALSVFGLAIPLFLFLWAFQLVRDLGYRIEHGKSALVVDGRPVQGRLRVFSGEPREDASPARERAYDPAKDCFAVLDLGLREKGGRDNYLARFGFESFSNCGHRQAIQPPRSGQGASASLPLVGGDSLRLVPSHPDAMVRVFGIESRMENGKRVVHPSGWRPGERLVTFVFSQSLRNEADWVRAGLVPDLVIFNWADWPGYLEASLKLELLIEALLLSAFLLGNLWLVARHGKSIFHPAPLAGLSRRTTIVLASVAVAGIAAYLFPLFHNVVFLWFGAWTLLAICAWKRLLPKRSLGQKMSASRFEIAALALVVLLGMIPRLAHLDWGFPLLLHPDEYAFTDFPPRMAETNSLNPGDFERPNHPSIYTNSMVYGVVSQVVFSEPLPRAFAEHPFFFHLVSRWIVAFWGGVGIVAAWLVGRRFHPLAGFWAAVLMAVHPTFLEHAHYATPDVALTAMQLFSIWLALRYLDSGSWRDLAPSVLWVSLATGEKYPGVLYLVVPLFALVWSHRREWTGWLPLAFDFVRMEAIFLVGLFAFAPYVFLNAHLVLLNLISESRPTHLGFDGLSWSGNLLFYARTHLRETSWGLFALSVLGAWVVARRLGARSVPWFSGLFFWVVLSRLPLHWERWDLPMVITPMLLSAAGLAWIQLESKKARGVGRLVWVPVVVLTGVVLGGQIYRSEITMAKLSATDTRVAGLPIFQKLGVDDSNSVVSQYTPLAPAWKPAFDFVAAASDSEATAGKKFAVTSSKMYRRFLAEPARYERESEFYRDLFRKTEIVRLEPTPLPVARTANDWKLASQVFFFHSWWTANGHNVLTGPTIRVFAI